MGRLKSTGWGRRTAISTATALALAALWAPAARAAAPTVSAVSVSEVTGSSVKLEGAVNPEGATGATRYRFEYGTGKCSSSPCTKVPTPEATSARIVLALVVAMVLAGCGGGGSSDSSSGSVSAGEDGTTEASTGTSAEQRGSGEGADDSLPSAATGSTGGGVHGDGHHSASSAAGKQGPHIVQPKGKPEQAISPQERSEATVASMTLQSPAIGPAEDGVGLLPTRYTCNGEDTCPNCFGAACRREQLN